MVKNICRIPVDRPHNPKSHDSYRHMLGLSPVLSLRVAQLLTVGPHGNAETDAFEHLILSDNSGLPLQRSVEMTIEHVRHQLASLRALLSAEPIVFVRDECFTNDLLGEILRKICGSEEKYEKFVREVHIDYANPPSDEVLREYFPGKRIVIIGGSESDTDTIHPDMYSNHLAKCIRESFSGPESSEYCHRFLAVCFGSQYAANLIGIECGDSLCVPATMRGPAQFWPSPCRIASLRREHELVQSFFSGLSSGREGGKVSLQFTRTGYVEPNFFSSKGEPYLIPVVTDEVTGGLVGWADRRSHRIFGMQAHPEIPLNPDSETLRVSVRGEVNRILHALKGGYGDEVLRLEDQFFPEAEIRNPGESFYTYALDTLTDELFHSIQRGTWIDLFSESQKTDFDLVVDGYQAYLSLKSSTMGDRMQISTQLRQADYLSAIDGIGKVELLCHPDWKVGRGVESYGDVAGVDMMRLLEAQRRFRSETCEETGFLTFNDFGAGNGTFLSEMRDMFERDKSAFFYGVGDRIYFDLYQGLFSRYQDIPEHVRMAFVQEVIRRYQNVSHMVEPTLKAKLGSVLADFRIDSDAPIDFSSMFTSGTVMFAGENEIFLSQEDRDFVRNDPGGRIASMLAELIEHPYLFINGSFDRITLVDFRDYSPDGMVPKEDIRVSIRGTSHLDAGDLMKILDRFVYRLAADWSVFVDNGVHRSYTSVPRLREYLKLQERYPEEVRVTMAYDPKTNYFCSAIIEKAPFHHETEFFKEILRPGIVPVSIFEAESHPFFRFERFFRDFLVSNFRSYEIFWFFNTDIVSFLWDAVYLLAEGKTQTIRERFVDLVGYFCSKLNERAMSEGNAPDVIYMPIVDQDLASWTSKEGDTIETVLQSLYLPTDWFNADAKRRY